MTLSMLLLFVMMIGLKLTKFSNLKKGEVDFAVNFFSLFNFLVGHQGVFLTLQWIL